VKFDLSSLPPGAKVGRSLQESLDDILDVATDRDRDSDHRVVRGVPAQQADRSVRRGRMNPTEIRFQSEVLDHWKTYKLIDGFAFEPMKLLVAAAGPDTRASWLTLDFLTWNIAGLVAYEIKGWWRSRDRVRTKVAAERHEWLRIAGVRRISGEWKYEWFS
jgi:hypothetical protein